MKVHNTIKLTLKITDHLQENIHCGQSHPEVFVLENVQFALSKTSHNNLQVLIASADCSHEENLVVNINLSQEMNGVLPTTIEHIVVVAKIKIAERNDFCDHCEEPKSDVNSSFCCLGCENAEIKFNQLDN